jgi:hypothetical protein
LTEPLSRWLIRQSTSPATLGDISRCLSGLPRLVNLEIDCYYNPFPSLSFFTGLQKLSVSGINSACNGLSTVIANSPDLSKLNVERWSYNSVSPLPDIFESVSSRRTMHIQSLSLRGFRVQMETEMLRHLQSLQSYQFHHHKPVRSLSTSDDGLHWKAIRGSGISLRHLVVDCVDSSLLDYLSSYSGLETFRFVPPNRHPNIMSQDHDEDLAYRFFTVVISKHAKSLISLFVLVLPASRWCFHKDYLNSLRRCEKLDTLSLSIAINHYDAPSHQSDIVSSILTNSILHYDILTHSIARSYRCRKSSA